MAWDATSWPDRFAPPYFSMVISEDGAVAKHAEELKKAKCMFSSRRQPPLRCCGSGDLRSLVPGALIALFLKELGRCYVLMLQEI